MEILFERADEHILVVIDGKDVRFGSTHHGAQLADISGLQLNYDGVCREFPDLETREDWKEEAVERFKDKIKELKTEEERTEYIIKELEGCGYKAKSKRRKGFRPIPI